MLQAVQSRDVNAELRSIHAIRQRLNPVGFQLLRGHKSDYGGYLCIDNLFDAKQKSYCYKLGWTSIDDMSTAPKHLKLGSLPVSGGVLEPPPERVWQITVCYHDGRKLPTAYGITLNRQATCNDVLAAVQEDIAHCSR